MLLFKMMKHRIFIAINLPEKIKKELSSFQEKYLEMPIRWTKKENLHITLIFLGYFSDEELLEISNTTREVAKNHHSFLINLNKIHYGPPGKKPPRMVWASGEKSQEATLLKNNLEESLFKSVRFLSEKRELSLHITLGRIKAWEWKLIEPEERPEIERELNLSFEVNSIEIMESQLKKGGAEYTILESVDLN